MPAAAHLASHARARPGDFTFLAKPLGSGTLTTAIKHGALADDGIAEATRVMATLNAAASKAAIGAQARACTDITGFHEIPRRSHRDGRLRPSRKPPTHMKECPTPIRDGAAA